MSNPERLAPTAVVIGYTNKLNNERILKEMKRLGLVEEFSQEKGYIVTTDAGTKAMLYYEHEENTDKYLGLNSEEKGQYARQIKKTIRKRKRQPEKPRPKPVGAELIVRMTINEDNSRFVTFFVGKPKLDEINQGAMYAVHKEGGLEIAAGLFTRIRTIVKPAKNFSPHLREDEMFDRWKFVEFMEAVDLEHPELVPWGSDACRKCPGEYYHYCPYGGYPRDHCKDLLFDPTTKRPVP